MGSQWAVRVSESATPDKPDLTTLAATRSSLLGVRSARGAVFLTDARFLAGPLFDVVQDLPEDHRLRADVAVRLADERHLRRQQRVGLRRRDERDELDHGSAVVLGPLGPGVGDESLASDGEEAVQVEIESFVDGLVPVEER